MELCPSCGEFYQELDKETGWCPPCAGIISSTCIGCGNEFTKDQPHRTLCPRCRDDRFLERNADLLEEYLAQGASITYAKREVYYRGRNRPNCLSCGQLIKGGRNGSSNFCTKTPECRRWRRRYRTLRERYKIQGLHEPAKQALATVSAEIFTGEAA